ncbi:matrixin family metalloprotease [bacterium]|jgi:hypothetical protein|nr:matrixin family metalloprotease [bacterium]
MRLHVIGSFALMLGWQLSMSLGASPSVLLIPAILGQTLPVPSDFLFGTKWGSPTFGTPGQVTWSFQTINNSQVPLASFMPTGYESQIRSAFQAWSDVANITFTEVPTGGQIRLFGQAIDGPGSTAGQAQYPGSGTRFIRFDTANTWTTDPDGAGSYVYQLALHEIGHSLGLEHPPGIIAAMNHVVGRSFQGLLPADIAGAQAIYGPSATINNSQFLPTQARTLTILPTSQLTATVSLGTFLTASDVTNLTGTINARIDLGAGGAPSALTIYGSQIDLTDVQVNVANALLTAQASFTGLAGEMFSKDWFGPLGKLTPVTAGQFDASQIVLGLVDGLVSYNVQVPLAGINIRNSLELRFENEGPIAFGTTAEGPLGKINRAGNDLFVDIPLEVVTTLAIPLTSGELPLDVRVSGTIHAYARVPEAGTVAFVAVGFFVLTIRFLWKQKQRDFS